MPARKSTTKRRKYIFVSGGLISGIGKGTTAASIALLLQSAGYSIAPIKVENYLNLDAGTINPIEHGDPFLCEDGTEADLDLGSYEKFLNRDMGKNNFVTMGKIYATVIEKERRFEYNGEDVEAIPHITDEINKRIKHAGEVSDADIVIVELGGTAGEYQNIFYYEASRILAWKNPGDVIHIHVSYVPTPKHLGEPKTKPTQLSVRTLNSMGIQPDFIVARSEKFIDQRRRDRFALFCNMHEGDIISNPDLPSAYEIPLVLHDQQLEEKILKKLNLPAKKANLTQWKGFVATIKKPKKKRAEIAIVGKYFGTGEYQLRDAYAALFDAIDHAGWKEGVDVTTRWVSAEKVEAAVAKALAGKKDAAEGIKEVLGNPDGIIVPIGWGERGAEGMILAANYAREQKIPYLGLCYGMQLACVAFARYVLGWKDANTSENDLKTKHDVVHLMPAQESAMKRRAYGGTMRLGSWDAIVKKGTRAFEFYKKYNGFINEKEGLTSERHRHRWEFNDAFVKDFEKAGLVISARSVHEKLAEIIELPKSVHPFYMGTQGHPEYKSRPLKPHPLFLAFIDAAAK
ncbi:MAG TPA: CTP synthase [Patescibacteria group bacterium]|nr:CTP synthase [Patescibacteria group bacterium]